MIHDCHAVGLNPATVDASLSLPFQKGVADGKPFSPTASAQRLLCVVDDLTNTTSGSVLAWDSMLAGPDRRSNQAFARQRSEQYLTRSQSRAHFLRQANGRPQAAQILVGRSPFLTILRITAASPHTAPGASAERVRVTPGLRIRHRSLEHPQGGSHVVWLR